MFPPSTQVFLRLNCCPGLHVPMTFDRCIRTRIISWSDSYLSLQSPFHSPWPQGFHKRTRFTSLPRLMSWPPTEGIHWIKPPPIPLIKRHSPIDAGIYLFHTCDSVGVALDQPVWQDRVGQSLLQKQSVNLNIILNITCNYQQKEVELSSWVFFGWNV